jgi:hypothetical protein
MRITEGEATRIAARFLESNGYFVAPEDDRGPIAPDNPPLHCAGADWFDDHWTVLWAPQHPEGLPPASLPLTLVRVDGATGEANFFIK